MNLEQGKKLINLAKQSIKDYFEKKETTTKEFSEKRGVFVTLKTIDNELKGCIGFPLPKTPLGQAVIKAARFSAFKDPRFEPLQKNELDEILIEISVLTKPELIKAKTKQEILNQIEIGKHGLSIELEDFSGLLLPQVPVEHNWTKEQFLENLCHKAGLLQETWKELTAKIYKFEAEIFTETKENKIVKLK